MTNGLLKGSLLVLIISLHWKNRYSSEHTKNPNANVRACPDVTFWAVGYNLINFNFYQNYRQQYTMIPITTVRGPSMIQECVRFHLSHDVKII